MPIASGITNGVKLKVFPILYTQVSLHQKLQKHSKKSAWLLGAGKVGRSYPAGVGCLVIAYLLTDTELETYFKNFLLSDHKAFPLYDNELPSAYSRRVLTNTADLTDEDFLDT
jgi:hypothetical protein